MILSLFYMQGNWYSKKLGCPWPQYWLEFRLQHGNKDSKMQWFTVALSWGGQVTPGGRHWCFMRSPSFFLLGRFVIPKGVHIHVVESVPALGKGEGKVKSTHILMKIEARSSTWYLHSCSLSQMASLVAKEAEECWNLRSYLLKRWGMAIKGQSQALP